MKRSLFLFSFVLIISLLAGCGGGITIDLGGSTSPSDTALPLQAVIDSPAEGSSFAMQPLEINYHATSEDGVAAVELSVDGQVLNILTTPDPKVQVTAVKFTWTPTISGSHVVRVRAMSSKGEWSPYAQATINIQGEAQQQVQPTAQSPAAQSPTNTPQPTPTLEGVQLIEYSKTATTFYFGLTTCGPTKNTFTIKLSNPQNIKYVYVFNRLWSTEGEGSAGWDGGHIMRDLGNGEYSLTFDDKNIWNPNDIDRSTFHYQFVAKDKNNADLFRSDAYKDVSYNSCP